MYDEILIPVDGTNSSNEALSHGIDLAQQYDATVHLAYIVDVGFRGRYHEVDDIEAVEKAVERAGERALDAAHERVVEASLPVETHVKHAIPHRGIIDISREVSAELVVMGTARRSDECRNLIGSATDRVVRMSTVPVHVVKSEPIEETTVRIREATEPDSEDLRAIATLSMKASYGSLLTETEISNVVEQWYGTEQFGELLSDTDTRVLVAETERGVAGFSQSHLVTTPSGTVGEIHWLHIDPDHRGEGTGTELYERTRTSLEEEGAERIRAFVLADYKQGNAFYRSQGLESVGSWTVKVGEQWLEERVYAEVPSTEDRSLPYVESRTTDDGEELFVNYRESEIGSESPFFVAYTDRDLDTRYGWFCSNCETFDTAMDSMGRIVCNQCGNRHKPTRWDAVVTE
jgi:nucleotide-binding universal stress UspA family protein/ribosomal protein S18 acetylase RimI-like enzyme